MIMAYSLAKSLRDTSNQDRWTEETVPKAAEYIEFTGDDNIGFTWVGNVDKSGDWKKTYREDLAMTEKDNPYGWAQLGGTRFQPEIPVYSEDDDDESDYGDRRGNGLGATRGSSHGGPYGVSRGQGNPDILGATKTSSGWRSVDRSKDFRISGRNGTSNRDDQNPYDPRLPMGTSDRHQLGSTNRNSSFDKQNFRKTKMGSSGQNLRYTQNPYGMTQLSTLREESERVLPGGSRPYDYTNPAELDGIATEAYDRKDGWKTMMANRNITDKIYRQFDQIKRRWAPSSGLSETGSVNKWDEQSTDTSSTETRSDSDDYDHKSLKKRCLVGFIILFVILVLTAAIVPAVVLTRKKDSDAPDVMERIDMQAEINNFNFTPGLNDSNSDEYYEFTHTFCDQIIASMAENNQTDGLVKDLLGCTVQSLSSGSVFVNFTVVISHGGNNGPPTKTQVKILVGVGDGNTGTVNIGIFTIDVATFVVQAIVVVTAEDNPLPTIISYNSTCQPRDECETSFARCLDGKCACAENRYYNSVNDSCLKVDCGQKPTVTHGETATSEGSLYGSVLKVTCNEGYALPGYQNPFNVTCVNNNSWANLPGCSPISCGNYTAQIDRHILGYDPNSFVGSVFNENVTILCVDGYENPAKKTETCQSDGKWTSNVRCTAVSCGSFQAPDHSVIFENGIEYENTVNITCNPGYEIEGEASSTCQANRNWTSYGKCNPILCKTFEVVQNSKNTSIVNDIRFNEPIIILCQDDHVYVGDTSLSCDENGDWPIISCVPVACIGTTYIDNGKISNASETKLIYQCNDGYETDDNIIVECLNDQWDSLPVCTRKDCGKIATLMNGNITYVNGTFFGDTAVVECDIGYELPQEDIIQCQSNGTWNYRPSCDKVYCDTFPKHAVKSSSTGYRFGDSVAITCEKGYTVLASISECQSNKSWLPNSVCQIKDCGNTSIENGHIQDEVNTTFGSVIFFACDDGFSMIGKETVSCLETGEWDALPICNQSDCGNLTLPNQAYVDDSIVECTDGFTLVGNSDIKCHSNGSWEPVGECHPVSCNATDAPSNGAFENETVSYVFQDILTVVCNEGYQLDGSESIECLSSGSWSDTADCQPVTCSLFTLPNNSNFIEVNDQSKNTYMSNFTIKCLNGYEMKGNAKVTCQSNKTWTISPECVPVMCKNYTVPPNSHIAEGVSPDNYFNESIEVMCDLGYNYTVSGLTTDVCQANKTWTSQVSCDPVSCEPFNKTIMNAELSQNGNTYGDIITVTCQTGYVLEGSEMIVCAADGSWSDPPTCAPINCTILSEILPENLAISEGSANLFHYNITVELACGVGYIINDTRSVTCQANGTWTYLPICNPIECDQFNPPEFGDIDDSFYVGQYLKENVTIKCQDGFKIENPNISTAECQSNGTWTTRVKCVKINCGEHVKVTNGNVDGSEDDFNSTITISCDQGYALPGPNISTCQANKTWSEIGQCLPITCTNFDVVENSQNRSTITDIKYGEDIDILCNDGFVYVGKKPLTCSEHGDWPVVNCSLVTCNGSTDIDHGSIANTTATALEFKCQDGYESHSSLIVQCIDGELGTLPNCTKVDCGQIQDIDNGSVIYINKTTLFGDTAVVNCSYGYEPLETQEITCQSNGSWSHYQTCALIRCPSVLGSNIYIVNSTANYSFEDSATVACAAGYTLDGSNVIECKVDGNWTDIPTCSLINCSSPIIANGNVTFNATSDGSTGTVICEYGYMHDGNGSARCENGTWVGIGSCETITCNPFMPQKNMRTQNDSNGDIYPFNSVIQVECDEGYQFTTNDTTLTCDLTGNWTVLPECEKIMCTIQNVSNGRPNPDKVMFLIGETYNLTCDEGYDLLDESNVTCDENGMWNKQLSCEPVNCTGDISLENGTFSPSKLFYSYGNEVSINCNEGFKVEGLSEIQCLANGSWSHLPSCTVITCANISVPENAEIVDDGGNTFGSNTTIKCKPGFYLTGINTSMCMDDENWLELGNCSLIECGTIPFIENTRNISANFTTQYNSSISYKCDEGYNFSNESDAQIVCSQNGMWEGSISCQKVKCLKLNIGNGTISDETNVVFEFGDIVQVQCNDNYTLTGNSEVRCLANGSWDDVPVCEQNVVCPTLTIINGNIKFMDRRANVTCFDLYNLNSSSNVVCQQNGSWTEIPRCDLAFCQPLTIDNGYINGTQTEIGAVVYVSCKAGYKVNGTAITTCEADGNWSAEVVCDLNHCISFDVVEMGLFTVDNTTAPFNGSIIPTCIPGTDFTPGSVREINCTENGWIGAPECEIQGKISFEQYTYSFPSGQEAVIKCIISNNPNWQHAVMKKMNQTIFSVWNDTGSVRVTDEISIHTYTAFHSLESTFEFGLNISSIICDDAGIYICEVEAGNFTIVKSANASVSLTGNATIPNISAPEFMNSGHGGEIKCTGNIGLDENGHTGNLSLFVTTVEQSIPVSEINPQCDGYAEAVFIVPGFPNNITEVTVRCETSTVEGSLLVSSNRTIEIRSSYVAFPESSYLLKIGQPGSIVCDVANIVNWTAVVISKPDNADFIKVFSNGTNNLPIGSNVDLSNSNLTDRAVKVVVNFNNVTCSDAAMESGTLNYTCTALDGNAVIGRDTTKITFQRPPSFPILTMAERVYEGFDSYQNEEFSCKGQVGSPPGELYVESTFMDDSGLFQKFLTADNWNTSYGWVNVGPTNASVACGVEVEMRFALREPPLTYHKQRLRCVIKPSEEIENEQTVYSDEGVLLVVPESICEDEVNPKRVEHPYSCHTYVQCSAASTFAWAEPTGCREDQCYNQSHPQACTNCTCQKRAQTIDEFVCEERTFEVSLDNMINTDCSLDGIDTINKIEISKDGQLYNSTNVGQSSFTGKLGKMDVQVDLMTKTASFGIVNVSCEDEGSYLIKIDGLSEEIIVKVSSQPKQPEISVPVSSYVNQEMTVQCMGYVGRKSQEAATRLQLQTHVADETEFIIYGILPTNQSMECSDITCECYETLIFSIFPTSSKNNSAVRCAALASDGSLVVSSEVKVLNLVQGDIYFSEQDMTSAIGRSISLECVLLNGLGANGAIIYFNHNNSVGDTQLCIVSQSGDGNCTVDGISAYATYMESSVTVNVTIGNISCSNDGRYICTSILDAASSVSINLDAFKLPKAPKLNLSRQIIDGQGTWEDRPFNCSGELGPEGALSIEWTINGTFVPLLSVNDTDNDVAFILKNKIVHQTSTCNNEVTIPFAFKAAYVNSELHGKRLRCKTSSSTYLGLEVLYSNEEEIKVVNISYCEGKEKDFNVHPFYCNLFIECDSNKIIGMHACPDNNCWDATNSTCKQCDQVVPGCLVEVTTTTPDPLSEQINCLPKQVSVFNGTRPDDVYCSLVNVEQINSLNISKDGNLLSKITPSSGVITFGQFISVNADTDSINVTFGTASCEDEGEYLIELNNGTTAEFSVWIVSNAEIPILNVISTPKLNQNLKLTCTATLGRGPDGTERTQVVFQRRKKGEAFEEYGTTHMPDCTTVPCVCFIEAEYSVLLYESWNETDVRCALKNSSTNVIDEALTSSISTVTLGDTEIYFTDVNKSATLGSRVELICKLQLGQGDQGVNITRTSDNLNCAVNGSGDQIHCDMGYSVSSEVSDDHQIVTLTIESMGCTDEGEYRCTAVKDSSSYASVRLKAQADPKEPILSIPMTIVENRTTPNEFVDYLWCIANIGSDSNSVVQIEIKRSGESSFSAFNLTAADTTVTTSGNCEKNVTITYKRIDFDNSYNNSQVRCSVYQNSSSTEPIISSPSSPMNTVKLLPESICDEVTNTTLYLPYPYSYPGSCRKRVDCSYSGTFVSIYTRECPSTTCPVFFDNGTNFYCDNCNGCI